MIYLHLFLTFCKIGLLSIGGGYAALPLIEHYIIEENGWLTLTEFGDLLAISQITPGPIGVNAATFVGTRVGGVPGALVATAGCVFPSCVIVLTLAYFYQKYRSMQVVQGVFEGLRPAVVALIASAGISVAALALWGDAADYRIGDLNVFSLVLFLVCLVLLRRWRPRPVLVMLGAGVLSMVLSFFVDLF